MQHRLILIISILLKYQQLKIAYLIIKNGLSWDVISQMKG